MATVTPPRGYTTADTLKRQQWLAEKTGVSFEESLIDGSEELKGIVENHVGYVAMPMAIASPLQIQGTFAKGEFHVPLCTVEGTLAVSMTRGFLLTHLAGGIQTQYFKQEISRSPIFVFDEIAHVPTFMAWVDEHFQAIKEVAESTTRYGRLLRIDKYPLQNRVILDLVFSTADAAGQNMVTLATHRACMYIVEWLRHKLPFRHLIECNLSGDKNPTYKNVLCGRGHSVTASCLIDASTLRRVMRVAPQDFLFAEAQKRAGSQLAGVMGFNMHTANALAAIYLATGQDVACVAENALAMAHYEVRDNDTLFASLTMPSLTIGTIGGGTRLKSQRRNLEMMGCTGEHSSKKLAEIICASALALELSLGGAIMSQEFAHSHAKYGR